MDRFQKFEMYSATDSQHGRIYVENQRRNDVIIPSYRHPVTGDQYAVPIKKEHRKQQRPQTGYIDYEERNRANIYNEITEPNHWNLNYRQTHDYDEILDERIRPRLSVHSYESLPVRHHEHEYEAIEEMIPDQRHHIQEYGDEDRYISKNQTNTRKSTRKWKSSTMNRYKTLGTGTLHLQFPGLLDELQNWNNEEYGDNEERLEMTPNEAAEEIRTIPEQPITMQQKREKLKSLLKMIPEGHSFSWTKKILNLKQSSKHLKSIVNNSNPLNRLKKDIEGRLGASVVAVFNLMEDLIILNFLMMIVMLGFIVIPSSISVDSDNDLKFGWTGSQMQSCTAFELQESMVSQEYNASIAYKKQVDDKIHNSEWHEKLQDLLMGTGILERTFLFSGFYPAAASKNNYRTGLYFIVTMLIVYATSLLYVLYTFSNWCRSLIGGFYTVSPYSQILFSNWDYNLSTNQANVIASTLITYEFKCVLDDDNYKAKNDILSPEDKRMLILKRIGLNILNVVLIVAGWTAVYFAVTKTMDKENENFFYEYAPTLTISTLDIVFPFLFQKLTPLERYSGRIELYLILFKSISVRLTSLVVLISSHFSKIENLNQNNECWETKYAQQIYPLVVFQVISGFFITFFVNVVRKYLTRYQKIKKYAEVSFIVPDHVIEIIYMQTVCWLGSIHSPLLPCVVFISLCLMFICNVFKIYITCSPPSRIFRSSKSSSVFTIALAISLSMSLVPAGLYLAALHPSDECTPFRGLNRTWEVIIYYICNDPNIATRDIMFFFDNSLLYTAMLIFLLILLLYYISKCELKKKKIQILHKRIKNIEKDKSLYAAKFQYLSK